LDTAGLFLMALLGALFAAGLGPLRGALAVPIVLAAYLVLAIGEYQAGWTPDLIVIPAGFVIASVATGTYRYALATLERRRVVDLFGRYVARSVVAQLIKGLAFRIGMTKRVHPHLFRHSYATWCLRRGMNPIQLQRILGHSDLTMISNVYGHLAPTDAAAALMAVLRSDEG